MVNGFVGALKLAQRARMDRVRPLSDILVYFKLKNVVLIKVYRRIKPKRSDEENCKTKVDFYECVALT